MEVIGVGRPVERVRIGAWIKHFPGGGGDNNCPRFWYVRDGFGCTFTCRYCYLQRFAHTHELGAEVNPDHDHLYQEVAAWMQRPGALGLILGEVTDAWGWCKVKPELRERNLRLIELFRGSPDKSLIFLSKAAFVSDLLDGVDPSSQVVLSWSVQAPEVAALYEMGALQARRRMEDARRCWSAGWRIRLRLDPMIPIEGWQGAYQRLAEQISCLEPEQVTLGSWRPRPRDPMYQQAPAALREQLEPGPDGRLRLRDRLAMYELAARGLWAATRPELALCKEELDVQAQLYAALNITQQSCNCLGAAVTPVTSPARRHLPVVQ